ncbi:hypothetical protein [Kitasatospora purpeofusca]|uniref:hypothetical protein n=1 Tax=Kitasatospora purpeofusca TaxID=67352 RepID=UPI003696C34D
MEQVVDLDLAAVEFAGRRTAWERRGLVVGQVTWRDGASPWPQRLVTNRSSVAEPDSIGVRVTGPGDAVLAVVLFRGGWAGVDFFATVDDAGTLPTPAVESARAFGDPLDRCAVRVFGAQGSERQSTP